MRARKNTKVVTFEPLTLDFPYANQSTLLTAITDYTGLMQKEYAIVIIIVIATVITPASDVFTLSLVVLPVWILHEVSIMIVNKTYYSMKENR